MRFYYVNGANQPTGPVDQTELQRLRAGGTLTDATAVIREGESAWRTYADYAPAAVAVALPPLPPLPPVYAPPAPTPIGAASAGAVDPTEEMVRQKVAAGAAVAGAAARVLGKTAVATARGTARALGDIAQQAEAARSADGASSAAGPGGPRGLVTAGFVVALVSMVVLPVLHMSMKGEVQSIRMLSLISNKGDINGAAVLALLLPIVGIALTWAMRGRWRMPVAGVALAGALTAFMGVSSGHEMVRRASMGVAESSTGMGLWVALLALLTVAAVSFLGVGGSSAARPAA